VVLEALLYELESLEEEPSSQLPSLWQLVPLGQ
jgi:hypothetical protein